MDFRVLGPILRIETVAAGSGIRELARLKKVYGAGRWRKCKGMAKIRLRDGGTGMAEIHWYEAHGLGRVEFKIKRLVGEWP